MTTQVEPLPERLAGANPRQNILAGQFMPGTPLTTGNHPYPLIGQRAIRGVAVMGLVCLALGCVAMALWPIFGLQGRSARIAPASDTVGGGLAAVQATTNERIAFAKTYVTMAETWGNGTVVDVFPAIRPMSSPSIHGQLEEAYAALDRQYGRLTQHRTAIPIAAVIGGEKDGITTIGVALKFIEEVGDGDKRKVTATTGKVALIAVVNDVRTTENPSGLLVTEYQVGTMEGWQRAGYPAFWEKAKPK